MIDLLEKAMSALELEKSTAVSMINTAEKAGVEVPTEIHLSFVNKHLATIKLKESIELLKKAQLS